MAETDNDKHWQTYLYEPDSYRPLALVHGNARQDNIKLYWYQNDHLGIPIALTSNMGDDTLYECQYNAYGQIINETYHQDDFHALPDNSLSFQGQYYDENKFVWNKFEQRFSVGPVRVSIRMIRIIRITFFSFNLIHISSFFSCDKFILPLKKLYELV
ncbi:hypothetical protein GQ593_04115 [Gilliamella sp. Pas-s25]|nr:hypothetical protein [Gilliamella sp. Pas-s25]